MPSSAARLSAAALLLALLATPSLLLAEDVLLNLRRQVETSPGSGRYHRLSDEQSWSPSETAVIVCDVWDLHHSQNAVRRVEQLAPRLNEFLVEARRRGMTVIHSPSDCMDAYEGHPARRRAAEAPPAEQPPADIEHWCSRIPAEEQAAYPIDQSDGGDDDDPAEHAKWVAKLKRLGRNPGTPWRKQSELIEIDPQRDYLSDRGDEVWNILQHGGIKNVILTGVHTNMCVLGRPFGLRQMARNGKNVVLVRDLTDTMYNPRRWPYVSHFTGTDLVVSHIERFVCPTITSDQLLGGEPFRFAADKRPHVVMVIGEQEYETAGSLTRFALRQMGKQFRVTAVHAREDDRNDFPGLEALAEADVALISVRRRTPPPQQLNIVRRHVAAGKPVVGIRTASHAFCLRNQSPPQGLAGWPEFDAQVFGGSYTNHYGNSLPSTVEFVSQDHPILRGVKRDPFVQGGSLYRTAPLADAAKVLLSGRVAGHSPEPVAWTFLRQDGGKSFYTSLGHSDDFANQQFVRLLLNAIHWAAGIAAPDDEQFRSPLPNRTRDDLRSHWTLTSVPSSLAEAAGGALKDYRGPAWYRCAIRIADDSLGDSLELRLPAGGDQRVYFNGQRIVRLKKASDDAAEARYRVAREQVDVDDANLLVVRIGPGPAMRGLRRAPRCLLEDRAVTLAGRWQFRIGDDDSWAGIPLPARYGASPDILFE